MPLGVFAAPKNESAKTEAARMARPAPDRGDEATVYVADRAIVRDEKTGALRKPSRQEIAELVRSLKVLTRRSSENLKVKAASDGMTAVDLDGRFAMVFLARPMEEGGFETLCVSTFEEAAAFLGLRPEGEAKAQAKPVQGGQR